MGGKLLSNEEKQRVVFLDSCGKRQTEIASEMGISKSKVSLILTSFRAVKTASWDALEKTCIGGSTIIDALWAAEILSVTIPEDTIRRIDDGIKEKNKRASMNSGEEASAEETKPEHDNTALAILKLLDKLNSIGIVLTELPTAEQLKASAEEIIKAININTDLICEELRKQTDALNGIKCNTRKRGHEA